MHGVRWIDKILIGSKYWYKYFAVRGKYFWISMIQWFSYIPFQLATGRTLVQRVSGTESERVHFRWPEKSHQTTQLWRLHACFFHSHSSPPPQHSCYKNVIPKPAGCIILMLNLALFQHLRAEQVAKISFYSKGLVAFISTGMHPKERILSLSLAIVPGVINPNLSF